MFAAVEINSKRIRVQVKNKALADKLVEYGYDMKAHQMVRCSCDVEVRMEMIEILITLVGRM